MKLLVCLLGLIAVSGLGAQAAWRLSDALGNDRGPAPRDQAGPGWFLRIEPREGGEERTLFQDGREESLRLIDLDGAGRITGWRDLRSGSPVWEVSFDPAAGLPRTETLFEEGKPSQISTLVFSGRVLVRRTVRDPQGGLLYEDRLFHWPDGTLRRLERDGPDGPLAEAAWSYGEGGRLTGAWSADEDTRPRGERREWVYAPGRTEELLANETTVLMSRITEALASGTRETKVTNAGERREVRLADARGRTIEEVVSVKGTVVQTRRWVYEDEKLVQTSVESAGPLEVWTYAYEPEDVVVGVLTRDGIVVREERVRDGDKETVKLYDRGELFLVEAWAQGKRIRETYYQNGQVVRERTP